MFDHGDEFIIQVIGNTADANTVYSERCPHVFFENIQDILAVFKAVEQHRYCTNIIGHKTQPGQVGSQALELNQDDADILRPFGHLQAHEFFHRQDIGEVIGNSRQVIQPVGQGHHLIKGAALKEFFHAPVQVTDKGFHVQYHFIVHREFQTQHPVGGRMLGTHVNFDIFERH